ncbi:MAG: hydrogenase maturation nickel metallochaperone HypA [Deltaproteobacteria bacterium]|nr:hydrogenase maturation nickel metallochaperone HypA [Deltaproteobacteria bacterium]
MHELGIARDILDIAVAEAEKHGGCRITRVDLEVGVLRGVVPENLAFLFGHVAMGTIAEGARLAIEEQPARVACEACGPVEARGFTIACPACGSPAVKVEGGDALRILSIDIDDSLPAREA